MKFTKMHGLGNDYLYVNLFEEQVVAPEKLAVAMSDRHFGVGSDGLVLIGSSEIADFRMHMFNQDGSRGAMCGNAVRCIAKYVYERGMTQKTEIALETDSGVKTLSLDVRGGVVERVRVDMGAPVIGLEGKTQVELHALDRTFVGMPVSMGNPHCVIFLDEPAEDFALEKYGPVLERNPLFPEGVNVEFVNVLARDRLRMRVWERGSGITLACGTGSCAALVSAVEEGLADRQAVLALDGGELYDRWDEETGHVFMTGPAAFVFDGVYDETKTE